MKIRFTAVILGAALFLALGAPTVAKPVNSGGDVSEKWSRKNYVPGEVLVKFRPGTDEWDRDQARRGIRAGEHRRLGRIGVEKVELPPGMSVEDAVRTLENDPRVEYAEPNRRVVYLGIPIQLPDDPAFLNGSQWYLNKTPLISGSVGSKSFSVDVDIDAPEAWGVMGSTFDSTMTAGVGVIDSGDGSAGIFSDSTGYIPNHEDLLNSLLFVNTGEALGTGLDNDANGYVDDVNGWDWADFPNDNAPADTPVDPDAPYHGTRISGIIAAAWGNGTGIAGIGMEALRVLPLRGGPFASDYIAAIGYAAALADTGENVRVLNGSWAIIPPGQDYPPLRAAITDAGASGLIFVAAAGNDNSDLPELNNDIVPVYPASYSTSLTNVLSVAAADSTGALADFSHFGPASVQIAAPGTFIYATSGGFNGYAYVRGTSFAAPIAAAALGLIMAADPGLTPAQAIGRLIDGGDFDARLAGVVKSGKRVNLAGALAPFYPYSGLAPLDVTQSITMYSDSIGAQYATFISAVSSSRSIAVLKGDAAAGWAVSPVSPGIASFTLSFTNVLDPVGSWETGPWRVTGIAPFTANPAVGNTVAFTSLLAIAGTPTWSVMDTSVGSIDPVTGVFTALAEGDRKSTRLNSSHTDISRMPSSA